MNAPASDTTPRKLDSIPIVAATACSILLHILVIGGWVWLDGRRNGTRADLPTAAEGLNDGRFEVLVQIRQDDVLEEAPRTAEQASRTESRISSRVATIPATDAEASTPHSIQTPSARQLLNDPETGLIFSAYFKAVRSRLAHTAQRSAGTIAFDRSVTAGFVLTRNGDIQSIWVPPGTPEGVQKSARKLLETAAPFPPFPSAIRHESIAFDVLFRSDANVLG